MRIIVIGGDGFVGWPTSLRLSTEGHRVTIVDNFARRNADQELNCESLTPISYMSDRVKLWHETTGKKISFKRVDVAKNYYGLLDVVKKIRPDVIVHLAEQRAAPYSMKSGYHKRYTVSNNTNATHNILCAIVESGLDIHLVHIGTAGVYGYNGKGISIPEGYLEYEVLDKNTGDRITMRDLFPMSPGSIYHMTKTMDAMMFRFYSRNDGVRITDLHQGVIWGVNTAETELAEGLVNRFDYCGDYGTVLNRFLMQGANNHPITVYGSGERKRAFIHIVNCCDCISLAIANPPQKFDEVKIFNQTTEQLQLLDLAKIVADVTGGEIQYCTNPRVELDKNELVLENKQFLDLGLNPIKVDRINLEPICRLAYQYRERMKKEAVYSSGGWRKGLICKPL